MTTTTKRIAIFAPKEQLPVLISLAANAGYIPVNTMNGEIIESDLKTVDCFYCAKGFSNNLQHSYFANRLWSEGKNAISIISMDSEIKHEYVFEHGNKRYIAYLYCPICRSKIEPGMVEYSPSAVQFIGFKCDNCGEVNPVVKTENIE